MTHEKQLFAMDFGYPADSRSHRPPPMVQKDVLRRRDNKKRKPPPAVVIVDPVELSFHYPRSKYHTSPLVWPLEK